MIWLLPFPIELIMLMNNILIVHQRLPQMCRNFHSMKWGVTRIQLHMQRTGYWRHFQGKSKSPPEKSLKRRTSLTPQIENGSYQVLESRYRKLFKPLGFTIMFGCCSFTGATIWQYETFRNRAFNTWNRSSNWMRDHWSPATKFGSWRTEINRFWSSLSEGQQFAFGIIAVNTAVFLLWRVPVLQPMMVKYFCSNPVAKAVCWPMVLSTFSHYSFWHLGINMYVLYTFSTGIVNMLGQEQFLALYLTAGVVSSFTSYVHKILTLRSGLSLGASGCLMGVLGYFCTQFPNTRLAIVFLPMFNFSADTALKGVIGIDLLGILLGWKLFDHAAHLGGVFLGISYALWGQKYIWEKREPIVKWWEELRRSSEK